MSSISPICAWLIGAAAATALAAAAPTSARPTGR
jgi:hypothetical protein